MKNDWTRGLGRPSFCKQSPYLFMQARIILSALLMCVPVFAQKGDRKGHENIAPVVPENLIPAAPVLGVEEALKSFEMAPGFILEAFAAEPLVEKPVALDYDAAGRLWVCEMLGYMTDIDGSEEDIPMGRIVVLEDTNQDGMVDKRTIFLDKLWMPRAVAVFPDGILYADEEKLRFVKRDGLKPVGEPQEVARGYIQGGNVEHRANGLVHGLDNWLYNAKSGKRLRRIDGEWVMEDTRNRGQWGITRDDYGRLFYNNNSTFLFGEFFAPDLLAGNPNVNHKVNDVSQVGNNVPYPIRVTPGVNRAYISKANNYDQDTLDPKTHKILSCTAAAGMAIYRGTNYPPEWVGRGLVTESTIQLVKAVNVNESALKLTGEHTLGKKEWMASTDERFRPVNIYNAPDGTTHVLDMYHGIIQHKTFLTSYLRQQYLDRGLEGPGTGHGRIYRVRHGAGKIEQVPDLDTLPSEDLVKLLAHPNGWHRDMAQRVLIYRPVDEESVALLEKLAGIAAHPLGQIHALWTLEGMGRLSATAIAAALGAADEKVVCSALWATTRLDRSELLKLESRLIGLAPKSEEMTVYLLRALGPLGTPSAFDKIAGILGESKGNFVKAAAVSGLDSREEAFLAVQGSKVTDKQMVAWLKQGSSVVKAKPTSGSTLEGATLASFQRGKALYHGAAACFGCHGGQGEGVQNLGPPLDDSDWVVGDPKVLVKVMLHGLTGPIVVSGVKFEGPADMPGLAQNPTITDENLADISTYVRNEWTNKADSVTAEFVKKLREETADRTGRPYSAAELGK